MILIADIERGGVFASIVGTLALLPPRHQKLIRGIVINKFRGDAQILARGYATLRRITKKPVLGTIPMIDSRLPEEDSIGRAQSRMPSKAEIEGAIDNITHVVEECLNIRAISRMCLT